MLDAEGTLSWLWFWPRDGNSGAVGEGGEVTTCCDP